MDATLTNMESPAEVKIGDYTFTISSHTVLQRFHRQLLQSKLDLYLNEQPDPALYDVAVALCYPIYFDLISSTTAIDGDPKHPLRAEFIQDPEKWRDWALEANEKLWWGDIRLAWKKAGDLNPGWYPQLDTDDPEVKEDVAALDRMVEAMDPANGALMPDPNAVIDLKDKVIGKLKEKKDFLPPS